MIEIITFLTRRSLGLKKYEIFRFRNQINKADYYYFTDREVIKVVVNRSFSKPSNVSYNFLLHAKNLIEHDGTIESFRY